MPDISITAANVAAGANAIIERKYNAGETITPGQAVYLNASNLWKLTDADSATAALTFVDGISLNGAGNGQPLAVQTSGDITIGGTVAVGTIYVTSGTAGGIAPSTDLASGDKVSIVGVGKTATTIALRIYNSEVAVPAA